jgi:hypothetical protein
MNRRKSLLALIAMLCVPMGPAGSAQDQLKIGAIDGTVRDARGKTVAGAHVSYLDNRPLGGRVPEVRSDARGHFEIHSLDWGQYGLSACKEEIDVPCSLGFNAAHMKQVTLTPQVPSVTVMVQLGEKAGVITGTVRDALNGKPIAAIFTLRPSQLPDKVVLETSAPPTFHIFIPASKDYSLEVSAPGYKNWNYAQLKNALRPLQLRSGGHLHLDVKLEPLQ